MSVHPDDIVRAARVLEAGSLVIVPTDTVYGLAAHPGIPGAEAKLFRAKGRDDGKPIAMLAASPEAVAEHGAVLDETEQRLARAFWPGPLTLVLQVGDRREGFRVPDCGVALALLREVGGLLRVTSANRSGEPPAMTAGEASAIFGDAVGMTLDGGRAPGGVASSVVSVVDGRIHVLRDGALSTAELLVCGASGDTLAEAGTTGCPW